MRFIGAVGSRSLGYGLGAVFTVTVCAYKHTRIRRVEEKNYNGISHILNL